DTVLVCDPGYPVYGISTLLAGGTQVPVPLTEAGGYLPDWATMPDGAENAKVLWLNYPSNPTSAVCELPGLQEAVDYCRARDILLAHDAAYTEITYDGFVAPSALQPAGALDTAVEFGSMSKTYNMTGWRVGWAAGSAEAIEALGRVKTNIDSGIFNALQKAAIAGLEGPQDHLAEMVEIYRKRRDTLVDGLRSAGLKAEPPRGALYVWVKVPEGHDSAGFSEFLLEKTGVVVAPGSGYGANGEGYVRFSLTIADERLEEGVSRIASALGGA
ncbi:MAG: aminotransferase class I/II-fold pyridoxal phosphate-dependent enzyme, partial [Actinomycetota bacterium]